MRNRGVSQRVPHDDRRIEPGRDNGFDEGFADVYGMAGFRRRRWKEPWRTGRQCLDVVLHECRQVRRDRLLATARLCFRDVDRTALNVDVLAPNREDFRHPHRRLHGHDDERVQVSTIRRLRGLDQLRHLRDRQVHDPAITLFQPRNFRRPVSEPPPFDGLAENMRECGEFAIDRPGRRGPRALHRLCAPLLRLRTDTIAAARRLFLLPQLLVTLDVKRPF